MLNTNIKLNKEETLKQVLEFFNDAVSKDIDLIIRHNKLFHSFVIFFDASTYKQARKLYPKLLKDKTAEYGKTIYIAYA